MSTAKLDRASLWSLEEYATQREEFRKQIIAHKKLRHVQLGPHATLAFEDYLTMKYQVQEMLRIERIFDPAEIAQEMDAYNPLIPDGTNWKATLMFEFPDVDQRHEMLARMREIEHKVWTRVGDLDKTFAIANEDMERSTDDKAAAVHFLRFELDTASIAALHSGKALRMGVDHPEVACELNPVPATAVKSLLQDLALH